MTIARFRKYFVNMLSILSTPFLRLSPNTITILSLPASIMYLYFMLQHRYVLAIGFLALSALMDAIDGVVARARNLVSRRGAFLDSTIDRVNDFLYLVGLYPLLTTGMDYVLLLLALVFTYLISYVRARAESLGLKLEGVGFFERAERVLALMLILTLFSILRDRLTIVLGLVVYVLCALVTALHRVIWVFTRLKD
ncbi:MAG: hypothetical protein DRJ40_06970 [Thermoprotei archaeon]|nr:MAG: hypothetical protein DRJ40_06970 [Thermoprotei archaeon]